MPQTFDISSAKGIEETTLGNRLCYDDTVGVFFWFGAYEIIKEIPTPPVAVLAY